MLPLNPAEGPCRSIRSSVVFREAYGGLLVATLNSSPPKVSDPLIFSRFFVPALSETVPIGIMPMTNRFVKSLNIAMVSGSIIFL